jgi:hypothetical protein
MRRRGIRGRGRPAQALSSNEEATCTSLFTKRPVSVLKPLGIGLGEIMSELLTEASTRPAEAANEESPLLGRPPSADQGEASTGEGNVRDDEAGVPLAEEPSTAKLILVLGSIWLGVFLASLGAQPGVTPSFRH